jgi:small subunit ribosomal protein S4
MKQSKRKYERPKRPWDKQRIEKEREIMKTFGLKRKNEIWKSEALLRKYRRLARQLAAKKDKEKEKILLGKLNKLGLLPENAALDDVLSLTLQNILERRLQTILQKKGLVNSPKQARQFIVHGHVKIGKRKIAYPSYFVTKDDEGMIEVTVTPQKKVSTSEG